jgi:hypothetical protein
MRARTAAFLAGFGFTLFLYLGAAVLWTSYDAVPGSLGWLLGFAAVAGFAAAFFMPRPIGGRTLMLLFGAASWSAMLFVILGFVLGPYSVVEPFTFGLVFVWALVVWGLSFGVAQVSRRGAAA